MPRATLQIKSNEALVALSDAHPETRFTVLGAWPTDGKLRVLIDTSTLELPLLEETLTDVPALTDVEIRHGDERNILFEVSTPPPELHGAMAESNIVPTFPLHLENGWFIGDLTASQDQLSTFRDELEAAEIDYRLIQVSAMDGAPGLLTERQQEVIEIAVEHGYYESPRKCTLTELAEILDVNKSVISRILHRAEGKIVTAYCSQC